MKRAMNRWRDAAARFAPPVLSFIAGVVAWELVGRHTNAAFLVPLSETLDRLWELSQSGELWEQLASSLAIFVVGFVLALIVGAPGGMLLARVAVLRRALDVYITIAYATPLVALIPFILSLMGFGFAPKVLVVFLFAVFPVLYNTVEGARSIRPELVEVARSFQSSETALWFDVLFPATLPYMMTGFRQAIGRALVGMVASEFFLAASGIGELIMVSSRNFDTAALFGTTLTVTVLGVLLMWIGTSLENRFTVWRGLSR